MKIIRDYGLNFFIAIVVSFLAFLVGAYWGNILVLKFTWLGVLGIIKYLVICGVLMVFLVGRLISLTLNVHGISYEMATPMVIFYLLVFVFGGYLGYILAVHFLALVFIGQLFFDLACGIIIQRIVVSIYNHLV